MARYAPLASAVAAELTGDTNRAARIARNSLAHSLAHLYDLRGPAAFETELLREVAARCRPRRLSKRVGYHERAVTALARHTDLNPASLAFVLQIGERRVRHLLAAVEQEREPAEVESPRLRVESVARRMRIDLAVTSSVLVLALGVAITSVWRLTGHEPSARVSTPIPRLARILSGGFDPVGRRVTVIRGGSAGENWALSAYRARSHTTCIEIRVADTYGDVRCLSDLTKPVRGLVGPDAQHGSTFVYGFTRGDVDTLEFSERRGPAISVGLTAAPRSLGLAAPISLFSLTVPDYLLPLNDAAEGKRLGYRVYRLKLVARSAGGHELGRQALFLGRPR